LELWKVEKDYINPVLDRMADDLAGISFPAALADDDPAGSGGESADRR
jgi:hypothetical protein